MKPVAMMLLIASVPLCVSDIAGQTLSKGIRDDTATLPRVEAFADGNLRGVVDEGSGATAVTGALGIRYQNDSYILTAQISVASTTDTVRSQWGATLLNPAVGKALRAGLIDLRFTEWDWFGFQPHAYASVSSTVWAADIAGQEQTMSTTALGLGFGVGRALVDHTSGDNSIAVVVDLGLAVRLLQGDIANSEFVNFKNATMGVSDETFLGPEIGLTIEVNDVVAGLTYYFFDTDVTGFSDGQIAAGISVKASLLK